MNGRIKSNKEVLSIFKKEVLELLKRKKFNGRLLVDWKNGEIKYCGLRTSVSF